MNPYNTKIGVWLLLSFGETEVEEIKSYKLEAVKKKKKKLSRDTLTWSLGP